MLESLQTNTTISHYSILQKLGAGGMGEVYLAQDTRLKRKVALKLLPAQFTQDADRLRRFEQEAQAASALNHPNIITIYEIGEVDGTHFIANEFIDGQTLRQRITGGKMKLSEALDLALQVASALAEAHSAGIVHRDIKPENVMVRPDGLVKVLDFGLAKLTEVSASFVDTEAPTAANVNTETGALLGTPRYMSPEQARGLKADARSDIFSLGVMLYEMVAGRAPFAGVNVLDVIGAILNQEPTPLLQHAPHAPAELQRMVSKALRKDREVRYQTARDLLNDLKDLKEELSFATKQAASGQTERNEALTASADAAPTAGRVAATTSSPKLLLGEIKRHKIGFSLLILLVATGILGLYKLLSQSPPAPPKAHTNSPAFQAMKITKLTDTGKTGRVAISPDGKYVVHTVEDGERQSLWVRHVGTGSNVQIIPPAEVSYGRLTLSPDGDYIYFGRFDKNGAVGAVGANPLYRVPVLGGEQIKVLANASSSITFAPDGKRFAFVRTNLAQGETSVFVANLDGSGERKIATRKQPEVFRWNGPSWSPDGKLIAVPSVGYDNGTYQYISLVRVADGAVQPLGMHKWKDVGRVDWLTDGSGVVAACSSEENNVTHQYYFFSYPNGEPRKITNDLNDYRDLGLTADSATLVTIQEERTMNVWVAPGGEASKLRQLTNGAEKYEGNTGMQWTPDGRIVFESEPDGISKIWIMNGDGTGLKRLTAVSGEGDNESPVVSPDGRYIVFLSYRGDTGLWRMNIDGSNPVQLTAVGGGSVHNLSSPPSFSPDGRWVIYYSRGLGKNGIWKIPIEGGAPVQITDKDAYQPIVSPDGKLIACFYREDNAPYKTAIVSFDGGAPIKFLDIPVAVGSSPSFGLRQVIHWMPDSRAIAYMDMKDGVSNIWAQPIDGGQPRQMTTFTSGEIFWFDLSRDGKPSLFSRGTIIKDVVLISNFKQ